MPRAEMKGRTETDVVMARDVRVLSGLVRY